MHETSIEYTADEIRKPENKEFFRKILQKFKDIGKDENHPYLKNMHSKAAQAEIKRMSKAREALESVLKDEGKGDEKENIKVEVTLWDIGFFGKLGFSSKDFPWQMAEAQSAKAEHGEMGSGSFGMWLLKRGRSQGVLEDIKSRPPMNELADPDYFAGKLRNWVKVWGKIEGDPPSEENSRA